MLKLVVMFCFGPQTPFLGKFDPGYQNCLFKMKFGLKINSNMLNLMVMFTFFCFGLQIPFLNKLGPKNQNCMFKMKFGT